MGWTTGRRRPILPGVRVPDDPIKPIRHQSGLLPSVRDATSRSGPIRDQERPLTEPDGRPSRNWQASKLIRLRCPGCGKEMRGGSLRAHLRRVHAEIAPEPRERSLMIDRARLAAGTGGAAP